MVLPSDRGFFELDTYLQSPAVARLFPCVRPYRSLVVFTQVLTLLGSLMAQVNPFVLRYMVNTVQGQGTGVARHLILTVSAVLLGKGLANVGLDFGQKLFGEEIRVCISSVLLQDAVRRILSYRYGLIGASLEQVQRAAAKAYLHKQIVRLPEQYRTDVQQLSGG